MPNPTLIMIIEEYLDLPKGSLFLDNAAGARVMTRKSKKEQRKSEHMEEIFKKVFDLIYLLGACQRNADLAESFEKDFRALFDPQGLDALSRIAFFIFYNENPMNMNTFVPDFRQSLAASLLETAIDRVRMGIHADSHDQFDEDAQRIIKWANKASLKVNVQKFNLSDHLLILVNILTRYLQPETSSFKQFDKPIHLSTTLSSLDQSLV